MKTVQMLITMVILLSCDPETMHPEKFANIKLTFDKYVANVTAEPMGRKSYTDWKGHALDQYSEVNIEFISLTDGEVIKLKKMQTELATLSVDLKIGSTYDIYLTSKEPVLQQKNIVFNGEALNVLITDTTSTIEIVCTTRQSLILIDAEGLAVNGLVCWYVPTLPFTLSDGPANRCVSGVNQTKDGFYYTYILTDEMDGYDISWIYYECRFKTVDGVEKSIFIRNLSNNVVYLVWLDEAKTAPSGFTMPVNDLRVVEMK